MDMQKQQMITAVASSSNSSSFMSSKKYDVFLSFRGEGTRRNISNLLYEALMQKKVETYIDNRLEKGDEISPALIKAIEDSHVSVVIFSENYASSKCCLAELSKIMECEKEQGQVVIPVFYDICPSQVRWQTGSYEQAFAKHEGDLRYGEWKDALTKAGRLAGRCSQHFRTDSEFIKLIVGDVLRALTPRYPNQLKGLVGIEESYEQIESLPKNGSSEVRTLGRSCNKSSSFMSPKNHDVFLSFRGEDTRRNFTSHLYEALMQKKVETYIDYRLQKGDEISPVLIKAIEDSHMSIVIFSENYASSKWCLGELSKIVECKKEQGQVVIPVFYNIDPSHVRKQTGSYKQAFAKHERKLRCDKWKAALTEAANLAGWDSRDYR